MIKQGWIVVLREELFDAINEWHHHNGHLCQERTWERCHIKYWNVTQDYVKYYCMNCFPCLKKSPVTISLKGSIKPILLKIFETDSKLISLTFTSSGSKHDPFGFFNAMGDDPEGSCRLADPYLCLIYETSQFDCI